MIIRNYDESVEIIQNPNWSYIPAHTFRILAIPGSGLCKTNLLLNFLKNKRPDTDKIYLYVDDPFESKYQLLVKGREQVRIKNLKSLETFFDYSQIVDDTYGNLEDFNPIMKRKLLILFDNMEADMEVTITFSPIVTRLFLRWRKLNFSLVFTPKSYFNVPKTIKIDAKHCCIIKVTNQKTYLKK